MAQFATLTSGLIRVSSMSDATLKRLSAIQAAEVCLLDYRPEGAEITRDEFWRMADLIDQGMSSADAAEQVQAETCK